MVNNMKKIILILVLVLAAFMCFTACDLGNGEQSSFDDYENLNKMLTMNYSQITVTVKTEFDTELELTSSFVISYLENETTVDYKVERFTQMSADKPINGTKVTLEGQAIVKDNVVTMKDSSGKDVNIIADIAAASQMGFYFKEENFDNIDLSGIYFRADVVDVYAFMGEAIHCDDMRIEATFVESFNDIKLTYTEENGTRVECKYEFEM